MRLRQRVGLGDSGNPGRDANDRVAGASGRASPGRLHLGACLARPSGPDKNSAVEPLAIHHVAINVTDVKDSVAFYTEVLGGTVREDRPDFGIAGAWINLGTQQVHLVEAPVPPNMGQHFAIRVDNLDAVVEELRSKGLDVGEPMSAGPNRQTFIQDPAGNVLELNQPGATPA